jgi:hypothetical protein
MNKRAFAFAFVAGIFIGAFITVRAPSVRAFLTLPLKWLTEDLHPFPSESLLNLIVAWPLWFIYWGCLGALVYWLVRSAFCMWKRCSHK